MTNSSDKDNQKKETDLSSVVKFDLGEFDKRLAGERQDFNDKLKQAVLYKEPAQVVAPLNFNIPEAVESGQKKMTVEEVVKEAPQSSLLASLALEAKQSQQNKVAIDQGKQTRDRSVHEALDRALQFFIPFIRHVNDVAPAINRIYRLDARSVFANLKWQGALVDSRKQNMSESAFLNHVSFSVNLLAPEPVFLKRPWAQFDALVKELNHLKIRSLDDLQEIHKRPKQEWLEARLDPALPVQVIFQANYELGKVDVLTRNLADFGQAIFRLESESISAALLEELGLFLIGRADKPPVLLRATTI